MRDTMNKKPIFLLLSILLCACQPTPAPTATPTSTLTPTPSQTVAPTHTLTRTPIPTWTPLPTLPESEKVDRLRILLETNNGCQFPCWWGITPGVSNWQDAKQILVPISNDWYESYEESEVAGETINFFYLGSYFPIPGEEDEGFVSIQILDGLVTWIIARHFGEKHQFYSIHKILAEYSKPDYVWIHAHDVTKPSDLIEKWYITISVVYQKRCFVATYSTFEGRKEGYVSTGCVDEDEPSLRMFPLEKLIKFSDVYNLDPRVDIKIMNLKLANGMDVNTFYETFSKPETPFCLETPVAIWLP
jgi:hypothetical protein